MTDDRKLLLHTADMSQKLAELHALHKFHPKQLEVIQAIFGPEKKKRIFIRKGRKGGGTEVIMYVVARIMGLFPNSATYIIGPTKEAQKEIMWANRRIHNFFPKAWGVDANEQQGRIRLANDSFVKIEGADDPEAARGWEGDVFVWDERKDHNPLSLEACYPNVAPRDAIWIELGSPPTVRSNSYYIKEQEILKDPDWAFFHWSAWDNTFLPGGHEWLAKERDKYYARGDGDIWEIEWEANYVFNAKRKVLPNFKPDKHIFPADVIEAEIARDKQNMQWITMIDPGYSTCFAVLFIVFNPYTAQLYVVDEIYSTDKNSNAVSIMWPRIEQIQSYHYKGKWANYYDCAATGFAVEVDAWLRAKYGRSIGLIPTVKARNDEDDYFRAINGSLAEAGQVKIARKCAGLINEVDNYETDEHNRYPNKNNHALDDLRYAYKILGFTVEGIQSKIVVTNSLPKGYTIQEDVQAKSKQSDFIGFGGEGADFGITGDLHKWN